MMDRSIPMEGPTATARQIASSAIDALGPDDLAAVVYDSGFANEGRPQGFTTDRARLKAAIAAPFMGLVNPPTMAGAGLRRDEPDIASTGDCMCGLCVLEAIERAANSVSEERSRQKLLLWIGSRIVIQENPADQSFCGGLLRQQRERSFRSLARANVTFYALDPSGLETLSATAGGNSRISGASNLKRQADLAVLPSLTGGRTVLNTNAPDRLMDDIFDETSAYYLIGVAVDDASGDQQHKVRVRVTHGHYTVLARTMSFGAADAVPAAPTRSSSTGLIADALPRPGLPLAMAPGVAFDDSGRPVGSILYRIGATPAVEFAPKSLRVTLGIFTDRGAPVAVADLDTSSVTHLPVVSTYTQPLDPGHYEVRLGAARLDRPIAGSTYGYLDVPATAGKGCDLSDIALAIRAGASFTPTLQRTFDRSEAVEALFSIRLADHPGVPVTATATLYGLDGSEAAAASTELVPTALNGQSVGRAAIRLPIARLAGGEYILRIRMAVGGQTAERSIRLTVN
jgi:VWFA-related protein